MKSTLVLFVMAAAFSASAADTACESWYQPPNSGIEAIERVKMVVTTSSARSIAYKNSHHGYDFEVVWDIDLTSFDISVSKDGKRFLFTQARVPTANHPENFTDLNLPNGIRLSVLCELK